MQAPLPAGAPPAWNAPYGMMQGPNPAAVREADLSALSSLKIAAIVSIIGAALGLLVPLASSASGAYAVNVPASGGTTTISQIAVSAVLGSAVVGMIIAIVSLLYMRSAFVRLRPVDPRFSSTPTFVLVALIAFLVVAAGLGALLGWLLQAASCINGAPVVPSSCINFGTLALGIGLLLLGIIMLLIGGIGTVIGIWRLGDRYHDGMFKAAAILYIFFALVGGILLFIGVRQAENALVNAPLNPAFGGPFIPPPPMPPTG